MALAYLDDLAFGYVDMNFSHSLIILGTAIVALGLALRFAPWLVDWFGHLPGDIRIQNENTRVFIPITTMIVVSAVLTLLANTVFRK